METTITIELIGLGAAIFAEIIKLFPAIGKNEIFTAATAIAVVAGLTFFTNGALTFEAFLIALGTAFLNYKYIVQPIATKLNLSSQK